MAFIRRMFRPSAVNSGDKIYRLIKTEGNGWFDLDRTSLPRSLEAKGIPEKYADTVTSILRKAADEITADLRSKIRNESCGNMSLQTACYDYFLAACSFLCSAELWFIYSQLVKEEKKYSHPTKNA